MSKDVEKAPDWDDLTETEQELALLVMGRVSSMTTLTASGIRAVIETIVENR